MKIVMLLMMMLSFAVLADEPMDEESLLTDQQRCEEWAEMDGIEAESKADYMQECLQNLNYADQVEEQPQD